MFKTSTDFRKSLEARLQIIAAKSHEDLQRLRRKVAFDRLLARIFSQPQDNFFLKGGYAMELRLAQARATKDIDLTCTHREKDQPLKELILDELQTLAQADLKDYFVYQIGEAQIDLENAPYGGARYPVSAMLDGKLFVRFQLDVGADIIVHRIETIQGANWLEFCGIASPLIPMISVEQQFAEKLHAYTLNRTNRSNSRVKDLIDMILLLKKKHPKPEECRHVLQRVFKARNTHDLPELLQDPPTEWQLQFLAMAKECGLSLNMKDAINVVSSFYAKLLSTELVI